MPIYVFKCECGTRFEHLAPFDAVPPECPVCGGATRKIPAKEQMPQTWRGTHNGSREYTTGLQRQWERRQRLEAKHPELAGDQRPIVAHEGRYHEAPLRLGDPVIGGHGHGHGHAPVPAPKSTEFKPKE
jgi:putative FmdB family regulatory protein